MADGGLQNLKMAALFSEKKSSKKKEDGGTTIKTDWDNWGDYMHAKVRKLDVQFQEEVQNEPQQGNLPKIFENVVIHINGYTVPPADEIRRLVYLHGGRYQQYYRKSTVTHIIATNLPDSKIKEIRDELVVHPSWILNSIESGTLLPVDPYLLYKKRKAAQRLLEFTSKSPSVASSSATFEPCPRGVDSAASKTSPWGVPTEATSVTASQGIPSCPGGAFATVSPFSTGVVPSVAGTTMTPDHDVNGTSISVPLDTVTGIEEKLEEEGLKETSPQDPALMGAMRDFSKSKEYEEFEVLDELMPWDPVIQTLQETRSPEADTCAPQLPDITPVKRGQTTALPMAGNPNFVAEFYSNSRLHYLSTWGAEFKKYTSEVIKRRNASGLKCRGTGRIGPHGRVIMHIDMDSFFVSVTLRDQPHLRGKPIAVCHAGKGNPSLEQGAAIGQQTSSKRSASFFNSMSEIASCSYEARAVGVRNGMFLGAARKLCPDIHCVPYLFDKYRQVSQKLYDILVTCSHEIEAVSCDEAYIDVSERLEENETPTQLAEKIRSEIKEATGCTASVGIGSNILLSRMCTRVAKPDGCFSIPPTHDVNQFMGPQKVEDLPGVGWSLREKLQSFGVETCFDLQKLTSQMLQREFGPKTGLVLYQYCRGVDDRTLKTERERKSVSAEINYGIRFTKDSEVEMFINELAEEVHKRLQSLGLKGRCITLKMKVRKAGAPVPRKFMGHGICDNIARSCTIPNVTDETQVIAKQCHALLQQLRFAPEDVRGMGIQISKLADREMSSFSKNTRSLLDFVKPHADHEQDAETRDQPLQKKSPPNRHDNLPPLPKFSPQTPLSTGNTRTEKTLSDLSESLCLPSPSQIDPSVFDALPEDIRRSIEKSYSARNQRLSLNRIMKQEEEDLALQPPPSKAAETRKKRKTTQKPSALRFEEDSHLQTGAPQNSSTDNQRQLLPSPSQIDPECLAALPDDVRQEIEQAYKLKNLHVARAHGEKGPSRDHIPYGRVNEGTTKNVAPLDVGQPEAGTQFPFRARQVCLAGAVSLSEVKKVVRKWTETYDAPLEEDISVLVEYLLDLIESQNLEQLWRILKFLHRRIQGRQDWQTACAEVLCKIQTVLNRKYGCRLDEESLKFFNFLN